MSTEAPTPRTRVRRLPELGVYEREAVERILDEALICHVGYTAEDGDPRVIPTIHARIGDTLYFHGSRASHTLRTLRDGANLAVAATIIDGIRFARSMFEHSMNYRSVVVYGAPLEVTDVEELRTVFRAITNHVAPGRGEDARMPTDDELRQTLFLKIPLDEASAKVSTGQAEDPEPDYDLDVWAGILPLHTVPGEPISDPKLKAGVGTPAYITDWKRPGASDA
jgi:nitroimidazol reductase NimA-like FMN-containing flavoprotein (pyridoxamine 5'-phosphate oxidase superfamily)